MKQLYKTYSQVPSMNIINVSMQKHILRQQQDSYKLVPIERTASLC